MMYMHSQEHCRELGVQLPVKDEPNLQEEEDERSTSSRLP